MTITPHIFRQQSARRFGTANPQRMDLPFWLHMIRTGEPAWSASKQFGAAGDGRCGEAVWCFNRFGPARVELPDGRVVSIGGEHEDHYDPDFCIYNDVVVFGSDGTPGIFGYPRSVFPPTDFHTATLVGDQIIIVGNAGYPEDRDPARTPVFRLDLSTLSISPLVVGGTAPGWLSGHHALLLPDGGTIRVWGGRRLPPDPGSRKLEKNTRVYDLSLNDRVWRLSDSPAPQPVPAGTEWPPGWRKIREQAADSARQAILQTTIFGHPLFALPLRAVAEGGCGLTLFEVLDGTGRVAVVEVPYGSPRETPPEPATLVFADFAAWLRDEDRGSRLTER